LSFDTFDVLSISPSSFNLPAKADQLHWVSTENAIFGLRDFDNPVNEFRFIKYDLKLKQWSEIVAELPTSGLSLHFWNEDNDEGKSPEALRCTSLAVLDDKTLLICGAHGRGAYRDGCGSTKVWAYDIATNKLAFHSEMIQSRYDAFATSVNGTVMVVGGMAWGLPDDTVEYCVDGKWQRMKLKLDISHGVQVFCPPVIV
jgi:hypothetical protein